MLLLLAAIYILIETVSVFEPDTFLLRYLPSFLLLAAAILLLYYFSAHIIDRDIKNHLVATASMIVFWMILRGAKYIAFEENEWIARHLWYLYYIPVLMTPQLSLYSALALRYSKSGRTKKISAVTTAITLILILFVLSNDSHQLVFSFQPGFAGWEEEYTRGLVFTCIYLWAFLLLAATLVLLFSACRVSAGRKLIWIPMIPVLFGIVYLILYSSDNWIKIGGGNFGELPESVCFMVAGIWISFIGIGLIPSNEGYNALFESSELAAQIADSDYQIVYKSSGAADLSPMQLRYERTAMLDTDTRLHRRPVSGGYVYWQDDVSELNRINEELLEISEQLSEETELLRLQNSLAEERARIEAKTKVYNTISESVRPQSERISKLCEMTEAHPESFDRNFSEVCLLGSYIKRFANLSLLAADREFLSTDELGLAVSESLRQLEGLGIRHDINMQDSCSVSSKSLLEAYLRFERLLEEKLAAIDAVSASLTKDGLGLSFESDLDVENVFVAFGEGAAI